MCNRIGVCRSRLGSRDRCDDGHGEVRSVWCDNIVLDVVVVVVVGVMQRRRSHYHQRRCRRHRVRCCYCRNCGKATIRQQHHWNDCSMMICATMKIVVIMEEDIQH